METTQEGDAHYIIKTNEWCCWNCKHSYTRMGLSLYCFNRAVWVQESAVQPIGCCRCFERKGQLEKEVR